MLVQSRVLLFACCMLAIGTTFASPQKVSAQQLDYFKGTVTAVQEQTTISTEDHLYTQKLDVKRNDTGEIVSILWGNQFQPLNARQLLQVGRNVVLAEQINAAGEKEVIITDVYRLNTLYWLLALFIIVVVVIGGLRGASSFIGMMVSLVVLLSYVVPQILSGSNPVITSLVGSSLIGGITVYIAHGFSKKSHVALASMLSILLLVAGVAYMAVKAAHLAGIGSEEATFLQFTNTASINLQGLLLGGILLGALGVLDDITISQASIVFELKKAKPDISWHELYDRALNIGKDHVASLVNTLVLAYAGANLPLFLLFVTNTQSPMWVTLNSDLIMEEIVRTLAGSIGLVLAVPFSSLIAATVAVRETRHKKAT